MKGISLLSPSSSASVHLKSEKADKQHDENADNGNGSHSSFRHALLALQSLSMVIVKWRGGYQHRTWRWRKSSGWKEIPLFKVIGSPGSNSNASDCVAKLLTLPVVWSVKV